MLTNEEISEFIKVCKELISDSTGFEIEEVNMVDKVSSFLCNEVAIVIGISGSLRGQVVFSMSEKTAIKIAQKIFEEIEILEFDEIARGSISEFGNIVSGRATQVFAKPGEYVDITPPTVATGTNLTLHIEKMRIYGINFLIDKQDPFEVNIAICEKEK